MVTKKELSGFKKSLTNALQKNGYTAYGRIPSSEEAYNFYAHLPDQEMVSQFVEDNNLDEINRVYRIAKYIDDNSGKYYSLKTLCKDNGIDYKVFAHAVENMPYFDKTGDRRTTQYHWIHQEQPSFNTVKEIVDHMRKLKLTNLNKGLKEKIAKSVAKGISKDDFLKKNKVKKEATYSVDAYFTYQKIRQQKKDEDADSAETLPDNISQPERSSIIPEMDPQNIQEHGIVGEDSILKDEEVVLQSHDLDDAGLETENYILRQEIKYLKKINKAKDKLIKALRKKE